MAKKPYAITLQVTGFLVDEDKAQAIKTELAGQVQPGLLTFDELKGKGIDLSTVTFAIGGITNQDNVTPGNSTFNGAINLVGTVQQSS